jgi:hypothetical protein
MAKNQGDIESCNRCEADIVWIGTYKGKRMPVDADTYEAGDEIYDRNKHTSHFDTCGERKEQSAPRSAQSGLKLEPNVETALNQCMLAMKNGKPHDDLAKKLIAEMAASYVPKQSQQAEAEFDDDIPF